MEEGVVKQLARWVAVGALFLVPLIPLIVINTFFFPFITGKAFFFRIIIEMLVAAWVVLLCIDRNYRPRFSWIGVVVLAFIGWMFIADASAVNATKAFWSNFERMEGWVLLIHLAAFFFASGAVLRAEKKWRAWFLTSLTVSIVIVVYGLFQLAGVAAIHQSSARVDASFGNSAYLAIYLVFNVFIALWLALTEERKWLRWSLIALAVIEGVLVFFTETRGAILGLTGGLFLMATLTLLTAGKNARRNAGIGLTLLIIAAGTFYVMRESPFVQNQHVLSRIASITLADGQTRFTIWGMAWKGVKERPIVGWGQEGFNYVFNKYYEPSLYGQESWFDRAHNAFIDWLSAGGIPAFLLYISLFIVAIILLWRHSELSRAERVALTAALAAYACHNLFVFDNLYSYVYFFALLALIDSQVSRPLQMSEWQGLSETDAAVYVVPISAVALFFTIWLVNVPGMNAASGLITAMTPSENGVSENTNLFKNLLLHPAFAAQEIREQLVAFAMSAAASTSVSDADKQQILVLAVNEMQKQVDAYPADARERLQLSYALRTGRDLEGALKQVLVAAELSPRKEEIWIEAGAIAWELNDAKTAQQYFNKVYELGSQFPQLAVYAAAGDIGAGDSKKAQELLRNVFGTTTVDNTVLDVAYYRAKDWPALIRLWKARTAKPGATAQTWFSLAASYYAAGDTSHAIETINTVVRLYPEAATDGAKAIKQIQGSVPSK